ncbi:hypothetical protein QJQ45_001957 [Haematococcus lacustris]|nr:hypothetical protein QJQ45_001957 [Haematococcus lacustris]
MAYTTNVISHNAASPHSVLTDEHEKCSETDSVDAQLEPSQAQQNMQANGEARDERGVRCGINSIRSHDRDVSAALNIRRIAAGPGRPRELSSWLGAMPNPGRPGQEWMHVRDKGLLRKWQQRHQRQR